MVTARMAECLLLMALVMATVLPADGASCGPSSIRCSSSSKCITHNDLCDGSPDCPGEEEDENAAWCEVKVGKVAQCPGCRRTCGRGSTPCGQSNNCMTWTVACSQQCSPLTPYHEVCEAINSDLLPGKKEPEPDIAPKIDIKELVSFMSVANCSLEKTSATENPSSGCPQLYTSVGNKCIATLPFALTWPEALVACQSIAGKLLEVKVVEAFVEVVQFLVKADFSANFWTGGFYDIEKEDWAWSSGPNMPRSTPYWTLKHNSTCVTRQSPTLGPLPGCFHYQQAPTNNKAGYCAALQFEYMYYISDEGCFQKKQPLCIH